MLIWRTCVLLAKCNVSLENDLRAVARKEKIVASSNDWLCRGLLDGFLEAFFGLNAHKTVGHFAAFEDH